MICKFLEITHEYVVIVRVGYDISHDRLVNLDNHMKSVFASMFAILQTYYIIQTFLELDL